MQLRPMMFAAAVAASLTAASSAGAFAQGAVGNGSTTIPDMPKMHLTGATAGECLKAGNDWYTNALNALPTTERAAKRVALMAENKRMVKECGAGFTVENTRPADLGDLTSYYTSIGDTTNARIALDHALTVTKMSDRARGNVLRMAAAREYTRASGYFGILTETERYVAQIDALPDSLSDLKILAHSDMLGRYDYLDVADGLANHANALIKLGRATHQPAVLVRAFGGLARSAADKLHPDVALKILDDAEKEVGATLAGPAFKDFRERYALIGTPAPAVTGKWWVNSPTPRTEVTPGNGKVTLVEFTAHWCGPCKNSYPGLIKVAQHFAGQPFQGAMATSLYGFLGQRRPLTPAEELVADEEYFSKEHAVPFPVAINEDGPKVTGEFGPVLDRSYRVGGIPQIMIIDKRGVIRQIVTGWDQGNTERFTKYIEGLLAEK